MSQVLFARPIAAAALVLATIATPALSADLYGRPPTQPAQPYAGYTPQSPLANWAGAYLGVNLGYTIGGLKTNINGFGSLNSNMNGADIGIYGGLNAVLQGNIILGAEADINLSDQRQTQTSGVDTYKASQPWNGTVRGRLGYAMDRFLPFVTGGIAFAGQNVSANGVSDSNAQIGYALGLGVDAFVTDRIIVKGEFIYEGFGNQSHTLAGKTFTTNVSSGILRVGAAYKF